MFLLVVKAWRCIEIYKITFWVQNNLNDKDVISGSQEVYFYDLRESGVYLILDLVWQFIILDS